MCAVRFDALLSLDHSRAEPWGSRHGQAFAAFALQHPTTYAASLDRAWAALYLIYVLRTDPQHVFSVLRKDLEGIPRQWNVPPRPSQWVYVWRITIAELGDFAAASYAEQLDAWCRSTVVALGLVLTTERMPAFDDTR